MSYTEELSERQWLKAVEDGDLEGAEERMRAKTVATAATAAAAAALERCAACAAHPPLRGFAPNGGRGGRSPGLPCPQRARGEPGARHGTAVAQAHGDRARDRQVCWAM